MFKRIYLFPWSLSCFGFKSWSYYTLVVVGNYNTFTIIFIVNVFQSFDFFFIIFYEENQMWNCSHMVLSIAAVFKVYFLFLFNFFLFSSEMTGSGIVEGEVRDNSTINIQCLPLSTLILALGNPRLVIILNIEITGNISI